MTALELREKRAKLWEGTKAFLETHRKENGTLSAEEDDAYVKMEQEINDRLEEENPPEEEQGEGSVSPANPETPGEGETPPEG